MKIYNSAKDHKVINRVIQWAIGFVLLFIVVEIIDVIAALMNG